MTSITKQQCSHCKEIFIKKLMLGLNIFDAENGQTLKTVYCCISCATQYYHLRIAE